MNREAWQYLGDAEWAAQRSMTLVERGETDEAIAEIHKAMTALQESEIRLAEASKEPNDA